MADHSARWWRMVLFADVQKSVQMYYAEDTQLGTAVRPSQGRVASHGPCTHDSDVYDRACCFDRRREGAGGSWAAQAVRHARRASDSVYEKGPCFQQPPAVNFTLLGLTA
eukprot:6172316-Pleurochrysis_carterae.AAC.2